MLSCRLVSRGVTSQTAATTPSLGEIIKERRLELGLTKSEAARRAGVSRGTWHEIEADRRAQMLAGTLALFDSALSLERGTLRRLSTRGQRPGADLLFEAEVPTTKTLIAHSHTPDVEIYTTDNATAWRRRLVSLAATMNADEVRRVVEFIERGGTEPFGHDDAEQLKTELLEQMRAAMADFEQRYEERGAPHADPGEQEPRPAARKRRAATTGRAARTTTQSGS